MLAFDPAAPGGPIPTQKLSAWVSQIKTTWKACLGAGGPPLTSAAFNVGVSAIQTTVVDKACDHLQFESNRFQKTFTDKHGDSLATQMHRLCGVASDVALPEIHISLAKSLKNCDHWILWSLIHERAEASNVPLTVVRPPAPAVSQRAKMSALW